MKLFYSPSCHFFTPLCLLSLFFLLPGCTENPLTSSGSNVRSHRLITGQITFDLADTTQTPRAYIWLEALNTGTYSESDGSFQFNIPAPVNQPGGGYTGGSTLYFFLANFTIDSVRVVFNEGDLIFNQGGLDAFGAVSRNIEMKQLLTVNTTVAPTFFSTDFQDSMRINISLTVRQDSLDVWYYGTPNGKIAGMYAIRQDSLSSRVFVLKNDGGQPMRTTLRETADWTGAFFVARQSLPAGEYRIFPYVWPAVVHPPQKMLTHLGIVPYAFSEAFVNLPFLRKDAKLSVVEPK